MVEGWIKLRIILWYLYRIYQTSGHPHLAKFAKGKEKTYEIRDDGKDPRKHSKPITLGRFLSDFYSAHFRTHHRSDASLGNLAALKPLFG